MDCNKFQERFAVITKIRRGMYVMYDYGAVVGKIAMIVYQW